MKKAVAVFVAVVLLVSIMCSGVVTVAAEEPTYTLGKELVENGDFEQGVQNWSSKDTDPGNVWCKDGVGRDGSGGMELASIEGKTGTVTQYYRKELDAIPGQRYMLSFDYLAVPNNKFYVRGLTLGIPKKTITLGEDADGTWKTYTLVFEAQGDYKPGSVSSFAFYSTSVGINPTVIDNVSIREYNVSAEVKKATLSQNELALLKGRSHLLKVTVEPYPSNMNGVVWESSDSAVATVAHGTVTAVGAGEATITMTTPNGLKDTCKVTVVDKEATEADLTVESLTWDGGEGQVYPGTKLTFNVTVKNIGTADVTEPFDIDISMGLERIFRLTYEGGVKAGESVTVTSKAWKAVAGDHMMAVRVNPTIKVAEANDSTNNTYQINLRVAKDLLKPAIDEVAAIVEEAGMTNLTFNDDFDTLDVIDHAGSGREGYKWYVTRPYGAIDMTPNDYSIKDGVMTLHSEVSTYNYGLSTADIPTWTGYTFNKGYMEFRVRMHEYDGDLSGGPAIWSMPMDKLHEQAKMWIEMDWIEYWGVTSKRPGGYYTITMHEQWVDENIEVTDWYANKGRYKEGFGDGEWHTLGCLWEKDHLRCYYDGEQVIDQTWEEGGVPIPFGEVQSGEMRYEDVFSYMNKQFVPFFINGSKDNKMDIDYIRVWQASDKTFLQQEESLKPTVSLGLVIGVGAGCLVVIAAVVGILVSRKRKQQA